MQIRRFIILIFKSLLLGTPITIILSHFLFENGMRDALKHGLFDYILLCIFIGALILFVYKRIFLANNIIGDAVQAGAEAKKLTKSFTKNSNAQKGTKVSKNSMKSLAEGLASAASFNVIAQPTVIPLNGGKIYSILPKGLNSYEIIYTTPQSTQIKKINLQRGSTGFNDGEFMFKIDWPAPLI
jgi:hypothetical protein